MTQELKPGEVAQDLIAHVDLIKRKNPKLSSVEWQIIYENMLAGSHLLAQLAERERELAEADRRAGAAERKNADLQETVSRRERWLGNAKEQAGFHRNVSFDRVWEAVLSAFLASKEQNGG